MLATDQEKISTKHLPKKNFNPRYAEKLFKTQQQENNHNLKWTKRYKLYLSKEDKQMPNRHIK